MESVTQVAFCLPRENVVTAHNSQSICEIKAFNKSQVTLFIHCSKKSKNNMYYPVWYLKVWQLPENEVSRFSRLAWYSGFCLGQVVPKSHPALYSWLSYPFLVLEKTQHLCHSPCSVPVKHVWLRRLCTGQDPRRLYVFCFFVSIFFV